MYFTTWEKLAILWENYLYCNTCFSHFFNLLVKSLIKNFTWKFNNIAYKVSFLGYNMSTPLVFMLQMFSPKYDKIGREIPHYIKCPFENKIRPETNFFFFLKKRPCMFHGHMIKIYYFLAENKLRFLMISHIYTLKEKGKEELELFGIGMTPLQQVQLSFLKLIILLLKA